MAPGGPFHRLLATASSRPGPVPPAARRPDRGPDPAKPNPDFQVLEIATYPEGRVADQVVVDTTLVYLDRRVLPEVLFLHPKRNIEAAGAVERATARAGC